MNQRFLLFAAALLGLAACKKDGSPSLPAPVASFSVVGVAAADVVTVGTYDPIQVANQSANAASYVWTLGNDSTKTASDPGLLRYPKSGMYTLTLTAKSADGQKSSASRTVKVLDRVIKQVVVLGTRFENTPTPHLITNPTVQAVLRLGPDRATYPMPTGTYVSYEAPVVFKTPLVPNVTDAQFPLTFEVPGKLVLDFAALNAGAINLKVGGYTGVGYGLELYVQDGTGTYLASSSYQTIYRSSAGSITWPVADIKKNRFVAQYSNVQVVCDYE
jgi:PKD repeat protein